MSIIVTNDVLEVSVSNETLVVEISSVGSKGEDGAVGIPLTHGVTPPSNEDGMPDGAMYVAYDDETASPIELYEGPPGPPGPPGLKGDPGSDATVTEENITAALGGAAIIEDDPRLTDSREWTADTVDQPEAESGTATTRRAWTAQRVRQAIAAWWASVTNIDGKTIGATTPAAGSFTTAKLASTLAAPNSLERPAKVWIGGVKSSTDMVNIPRLSFVPNTNVNSNGAYGGELLFQSNQSNPEHGSGIRAKQDSTDIRRNNVELFTSYFVSGTRDEKALTRLRVDSTGSTTFTPDGVNAVGVFSSTGLSVTGALDATGNTTLGDASTDTVTVNGYMGVGGAASSSYGLWVRSGALSGSNQQGVRSDITVSNAATGLGVGVLSKVSTSASSFTSSIVSAFYAVDATKGAGSTITNLHGLYIADQTQGTNNFGITSLVSSGTNKWNIYASGTASNYFAGNVGIGTTSPANRLDVISLTATNDAYNPAASFGVSAGGGQGGVIGSRTIAANTTQGMYIHSVNSTTISAGQSLRFHVGALPATATDSSTERLRITSTGVLDVLSGQIKFPATQNASADANTLDDYREATYTATATGMTTSLTGTVRFVRVGNTVTLTIPYITGTSNSTEFKLTGGPTTMRPTGDRYALTTLIDSGGAAFVGGVHIDTVGTISFSKTFANYATSFTSSGTKACYACSISYTI